MAFASADRVKETTTTTGTGTISLDGAVSGFQSFVAGIGDGSQCQYAIVHQSTNEWEVGEGYVVAGSPDTLTRDLAYAGTAGAWNLVDFSAGTKDVFITFPALEAAKVPNIINGGAGGILVYSSAAQNGPGPNVFCYPELTYAAGTLSVSNVFDDSVDIEPAAVRLYNAGNGAGSLSTTYATYNGTSRYGLVLLGGPSDYDGTVQLRAGTASVKLWGNPDNTIQMAGSVAINKSLPGAELDVAGTLRLSGSTSGYVGLAPAAAAGSTTYTLPSADGTSGQVLSTNGSGTLSWASKAASGANSDITSLSGLTTALTAAQGGTGQSSYTTGDILYASGTTALSKLAGVATGNALISGGVGAAPSWGQIGLTTHVTGTLPVANGGTGVTTSTGSGSVVLSSSPTLTTPVLGTPTSGTLTSCTGLPLTTGVTGTLPTANGGTNLTSFTANGAVYATSTSALTTGTLPVGSGGTGATTLTGILKGNGTSAVTAVTAPSGTIVGTTDTQTLTNKRIDPRVSSTSSITSPLAINSDNFDVYAATAQSTSFTISADSGTPVDGQKLIFRVLDNGTTRTITFTGGASKAFRPVGVTLTTSGSDFTYATTINKTAYFGCIYNANAARWDIIAISQE